MSLETLDKRIYGPLLTFLAGKLNVCQQLSSVLSRSESSIFLPFLHELTSRTGQSLAMIDELLNLEFELKAEQETGSILRGNSFCTTFITKFAMPLMNGFLKRQFSSVLSELLAQKEEVDEMWYLQHVEGAFVRLTRPDAINMLPRKVRAVVSLIADKAQEVAPSSKYKLMAGFLFLRIYNPCLVSPKHYGLILPNQSVDAEGKAHLMVFTKVFQHLSNNTKFSKYPMLSKWLEESQVRVKNFFDAVVDDADNFRDLVLNEPKPVDLKAFDTVLIVKIHQLIDKHRAELVQVCDTCMEAGLDDVVADYRRLFQIVDDLGDPIDLPTSLSRGSNGASMPKSEARSPRSVLNDSTKSMTRMKTFLAKRVGSPSTKREIAPLLDTEDLMMTPSIVALKIIQAMRHEKSGVPVAEGSLLPAYAASDMLSWLVETLDLSHRGEALILLRRLCQTALLVPFDHKDRGGQLVQDDGTLYHFPNERVKLWESFFSRGGVQEVLSFDSQLNFVRSKLIQAKLMRAKDSDPAFPGLPPNRAHQDAATRNRLILGQICSKMLDSVFGIKLEREKRIRYTSFSVAQEWICAHLGVGHLQSADVLESCYRFQLIHSVVGLDLKKLEQACVLLILQVLQTASSTGNIGELNPRLFERDCLFDFLMGSPLTDTSPNLAHQSVFGHIPQRAEVLLPLEYPSELLSFRGSAAEFSLERLTDCWDTLTKFDYIRSRSVLSKTDFGYPHATYYYVTSIGVEYMIDRLSCVPPTFVFDAPMIDAVLKLTCGVCGKVVSALEKKISRGNEIFHQDCLDEDMLADTNTEDDESSRKFSLARANSDIKKVSPRGRWKIKSPRGRSASVCMDDSDNNDEGKPRQSIAKVLSARRKLDGSGVRLRSGSGGVQLRRPSKSSSSLGDSPSLPPKRTKWRPSSISADNGIPKSAHRAPKLTSATSPTLSKKPLPKK